MKKLLLIIFFIGQLLWAFSISIDQPSLHLETDRGSYNSYKIVVRNDNESPLNVKVYVKDWLYAPNGGKQFLEPGKSSFSCAGWITFNDKKLAIPPKSKKDFWFQLKTPDQAEGGHQAVIFFETEVPASGNSLTYGARLGSIIYQETKGYTSNKLEVIKKTAQATGDKAFYEIVVRNDGNAWNKISGTVSLAENDEITQKESVGPYNLLPGQQVSLKGNFSLKQDNWQVLFTLEDFHKQLLSDNLGADALLPKQAAVEARVASLTATVAGLTENINLEPLVSLAKYTAQFNTQQREISLSIMLTTNVAQKVNASVKVYSAGTKQKVKTVQFNEKIIYPEKAEHLSVVWPVYNTLPPGKYTCVLNVQYGEKSLTDKAEITIPKK